MVSFISKLDFSLHQIHQKYSRRQWAKNQFNQKQKNITPLSDSIQKEILSFWKQYLNIRKELYWFGHYNTFCENKHILKYYIPDTIYYATIDFFFTNPYRSIQLDDKNLYSLFFYDVKMPRTLVRKTNGILLDDKYHKISIKKALDMCKSHRSVICKKAVCSEGGKGVKFFDFQTSQDDAFHEYIDKNDEIIIQEIIEQHKTLDSIHDKSINTLRIITLFLDNSVHILSTVLRMGRDGSRIDNASSGGIFCGIDETGHLKEFAYDVTGRRLSQHPQGVVFKGLAIKGYHESCNIAKSLAGRICGTSRLVSWDFAIGKDGEPILIEANLSFGQVDFHQICNGPIFGELTETVLQLVFNSKQ